ncbi:MAG: efflux transporter outer membrane subunit [Pseudomonadota bacterium]|nr:efflux transporter outer membrane subunit [Pseudomonadota bacterium]
MVWRAERALAAGAILAAAMALCACATAPPWQPPQAAFPADFATARPATPLPDALQTARPESPQHLVAGAAPPADWWREFNSVKLEALIDEALARHPDIDAARAALQQAQAELAAARAEHLAPLVRAQGSAARQRVPAAVTGLPVPLVYNLFQTSVAVSYSPDLSGAVREALQGLGAQVDVQRYQLEAVRLALGGNIATTAFREAGLRAQIETTRALLGYLAEQRELARARLRAGAVTAAEVLTAEVELGSAAAALPALDKALAQTRDQLARYVGRPSGDGDGDGELPVFALADFELPVSLPLSVPSELARQRPDLRAAEAALQAANAAIGVAHANRFPSLNLSAALGMGSLTLPGLLRAAGLQWSFGASAAATVFDGGALAAHERSAQAAYAQVEAQYRSTVLNALQNVVDVLAALQHDARALDAQRSTLDSARAAVSLLEQQQALGGATRQQLLVARINALQAELPLGGERAARLADTAALYQALGGGWSGDGAAADTDARSAQDRGWRGEAQ